MFKVYLFKKLEDVPHLPILNFHFGAQKGKRLFGNIQINEKFFELVGIEDADFILIPHNYPSIKERKDYIEEVNNFSTKSNRKNLVFAYGDYDGEVEIKNSIVLRTSQYKYNKKENEYIIPPMVEDLGEGRSLSVREKSDKATIGFVGWADFPNVQQKLKYYIKNFFLNIKFSYREVHKQGLYFRRRAINSLEKSSLVKTNFILRKSYSGHSDTIELDPSKAREEYIKNIINSDFILAPKGDGNYSLRFYEVLSLGRIPILIDTETVLPLEDVIDYNSFVLRVSYKDVSNLGSIVSDFYKTLNNEDFIMMQKKARDCFEMYLGPKVFIEKLSNKIKDNKIE